MEAEVTMRRLGCARHSLANCVGRALSGSRTRGAVPGVRQDGPFNRSPVMAWLVLVLSGVLEVVWAVALGKSEGFSRVTPTLVFVVGIVLSMTGLAYALRSIPTGTGYAVWVGI